MSLSQIASRVDPGLVDVASPLAGQDATDYGTGIVLASDGEVLTNNHVINGAKSVSVTDIGSGKTYKANVVGYDESRDIAVLQVAGGSGLRTAAAGDSSAVKAGDSVVGIGNAGGAGGTPSVAAGTVTALGQSITASDESSGTSEQLTGMIETNADIQSGDSGGPLVNAYGQVIGMDTAGSSSFRSGGPPGGNGYGGNGSPGSGQASTMQGYSIPVNTALPVAREIEAGQASPAVHIGATAFLGVGIAPPDDQNSAGVTLEGAEPGTPAYAAGLTRGDVITSVAGQQVRSGTSIQQVLERYHPGDKIGISWTGTSASRTPRR
jgi:S1-C subfamily serine protease